jgi:hypothetical protein
MGVSDLTRVASGSLRIIRCGWGQIDELVFLGGTEEVRAHTADKFFTWVPFKTINNDKELDVGKRISRSTT